MIVFLIAFSVDSVCSFLHQITSLVLSVLPRPSVRPSVFSPSASSDPVFHQHVTKTLHLGCWDEVLSSSYRELEPAILVSYLFRLANFTNKAFKVLAVKGQPDDVAR